MLIFKVHQRGRYSGVKDEPLSFSQGAIYEVKFENLKIVFSANQKKRNILKMVTRKDRCPLDTSSTSGLLFVLNLFLFETNKFYVYINSYINTLRFSENGRNFVFCSLICSILFKHT